MARVLVDGDSSTRPPVTNLPAVLGFPLVAAAAAATLRAFLLGGPWAAAATKAFHGWGTGAEMFVALLAGLLALWPWRRLFFRRACASCGGLRLEEVQLRRRRTASLIGAADEWRCLDCAARGNTVSGDAAELAHADAPGSHESVLAGVVALAFGAAALAALVHANTSETLSIPASPLLPPAVAAVALGVSVGWLRSARRFSGATWLWLVVPGTLVLGVVLAAQ